LGAAALYQQPCIEEFAFANGQTMLGTAVRNTTFYARSKFSWGWHLWGLWSFDRECSFATLGYKHLCSLAKPHRAINNGFSLFTIANLPAVGPTILSAVATQKIEYNSAYVYVGRDLCSYQGSHFYLFGGGRYLGLEVRRKIKAVTTTVGNTEEDRSCFQGGGVECGIGGAYSLGCGFCVVGNFSGIALVGERRDSYSIVWLSNRGIIQNYPTRTITKCVSGIDWRAGINYSYKWLKGRACFLVAEIGWEMEYYWSVLLLRNTRLTVDILTAIDTHALPFGISGPYASLSLRY
jgi:hypothetical protein